MFNIRANHKNIVTVQLKYFLIHVKYITDRQNKGNLALEINSNRMYEPEMCNDQLLW